MEAFLNFHSEIVLNNPQKFHFTDKSGSQWTLLHDWIIFNSKPKARIYIQKETEGFYRFYTADLEIYTVDGRPMLELNSKGAWNNIELFVEQHKILVGLFGPKWERNRDLHKNEFWKQTLLYKIKLFPLLELQKPEYLLQKKEFENECRRSLASDVCGLFHNPEYDYLHDVIIISRDVEVKAHKNILSVRVPEMCAILNGILRRREQDNLDVVRLGDRASPGLFDIVLFLYTGEFPTNVFTLGNMSITAKEMGAKSLQELILRECIAIMSTETAVYIAYLTDYHGFRNLHKNVIQFLQNNFEQVTQTTAGTYLEIFYYCLNRENIRLPLHGQRKKEDILILSCYMATKICYEYTS